MSQLSRSKKEAGRARKQAREEKQAKVVINSIFAGLIVLALIFVLVYMSRM